MNHSSSLLTVAAAVLSVATGALAFPSCARAQQFNLLPAANTSLAADPAATPPAGDEPVNVEKIDPNLPNETEILATRGANFESKDRVAVFEGDVRVNDPRFQLACETLTVYLAKAAVEDTSKGAGPASANPLNRLGSAAAQGKGGSGNPGGIDHALAVGRVIIIQKRPPAKPGEEPKVSIGRAERAEYDNKTGDMVLRGTPSIEQNGNIHMATSPATVMTLHRDNSLTTSGPSRTKIKGKSGSVDLPGSVPSANPGRPGQGDKKRRGAGGATPG